MAKTVVAFVGENANGILECQSRRFLDLLQPLGLKGEVLQLDAPDFIPRFDELLRSGIEFAWGYAGIGSRLALGERNLWEAIGVPFISVLADPPYMMPANHHVGTGGVVNGYIYREWLDLQQAQFRAPQVSTLLPMGVVPNPARDTLRWSERPTRMLFVKGGADPAHRRALWAQWPARLRPVLHDCADSLAKQGTRSIVPVVQACLEAHDLLLDGSKPLLFGLLHELDTYVRALRATAMARALLPLPVDIVGGGWEHVQGQGGRARFHPAMDARGLEGLYAKTQVLVNVTPNFGSGAHERVLRGFAARCGVLSDDNDFSRTHLHALPSYCGVEWHEPDLADRVAAVFHQADCTEDELDESLDYVERQHDPLVFLTRMHELADLVRTQEKLSCYALDAA